MVEKTDAKGQTTGYAYDALNRLIRTTYADGSSVSYSYDTCDNGIGRLCRIDDPSGSTAWRYDLHGRPLARSQSIVQEDGTSVTLTTAYAYDGAGRLAQMTYPSGMVVDYGYDRGRIVSLAVNGQTVVREISYAPFGPISGWTWADGSRHRREYDHRTAG